MSEAIGESFEVAAGYAPTVDETECERINLVGLDTNPEASAVLARMFAAFVATFAKTLGRIVPAGRMTFGPGVTPRVTLHALTADAVSDGIAWYHVSAGRSSSMRREGYLRACVVQAALLLACRDRKGASRAMQAHGAESPEGPKPEQWARALEGASGAIGESFAAMVTAQGGYVFPFGSKSKKTGKTANRWYLCITDPEGKEVKISIRTWMVPSASDYDPEHDGDGVAGIAESGEIVTDFVLCGIKRTVTLKRVNARK